MSKTTTLLAKTNSVQGPLILKILCFLYTTNNSTDFPKKNLLTALRLKRFIKMGFNVHFKLGALMGGFFCCIAIKAQTIKIGQWSAPDILRDHCLLSYYTIHIRRSSEVLKIKTYHLRPYISRNVCHTKNEN